MTKNQQPIEKMVRSSGDVLDVHSIFYTIQGEGPFCGSPAVFIRLAGCNLQCPLCDTEYTQGRRKREIISIVSDVIAATPLHLPRFPLVVITGGEPFRQPIGQLLRLLIMNGFHIQVETNGTLPPPSDYPWGYSKNPAERTGTYIVCSPKSGKLNKLTAEAACCFKYVAQAHDMDEDGLPTHALEHPANPRLARPPVGYDLPIYLQPADEQNEGINRVNTKAVVDSAMRHGYIVQLQIHKLLNME